uniref:G-protein coupled receptors family 2 profile 2 domain-containing protein n=1 Tax=Amphimedon queenslandica TaxID=400682 RepID=A0A1X7T9F7_AMPQE
TNVTAENVVQVAQNLSEVVMTASQPGDQNEYNLRNVSSLLVQTANLFSSPNVITVLSTKEVSMATKSTVEILDNVQEWPSPVVATQSNNIIQSFERIVEALISQENFTNLIIIETGIAFQGLRVQKTNFSSITFSGSPLNDFHVAGITDDPVSYDISNSGLATIRLPASISNDISTRTGNLPPPRPVTVTLEIVSYIGVCLSLLGLVLTILTLLIFKSLRQRDTSKFHIQLCLSLIFMLIVFVVGIDRVSVRAGCITVGVLIHYFALVSWMWMGAEAVLMFQKLVIVFTNLTWKYFLIVSITCWGLPLLPVAIVLSVDVDHYITFYEHTEEGFCFLGQLNMFLTAFFVPVMIILILNSIIYILVLCLLILHTLKKNKRLQKSTMKLSQAIKMLLSFTGIMLLFGLTWIFAVFTFTSEPGVSYTVQFFFAFFNAFQGFFIFVFFIVLSNDSRTAWKSLLCRCMMNNEQQTSKYNLSSLNSKKKRFPNSNTYSSSETGNERCLPSLSKEDNVSASQEKKSDDLDLVQLKGTHEKCDSTSTHECSSL